VGQVQSREQADPLGRCPVLGPVQQGPAGPVGVRRPQQRAYLHKFSWTSIVRHQIVDGTASPDDPALVDYWTKRRRKTPLPIDKTSRWLLKAQDGRCPICQDALVPDDDRPQTPREWETWLATTRKMITKVITREDDRPDEHQPRLIHVDCRIRSRLALLPAYDPAGLA